MSCISLENDLVIMTALGILLPSAKKNDILRGQLMNQIHATVQALEAWETPREEDSDAAAERD